MLMQNLIQKKTKTKQTNKTSVDLIWEESRREVKIRNKSTFKTDKHLNIITVCTNRHKIQHTFNTLNIFKSNAFRLPIWPSTTFLHFQPFFSFSCLYLNDRSQNHCNPSHQGSPGPSRACGLIFALMLQLTSFQVLSLQRVHCEV